jgi:hypothetical protein
MAALRAVEHDPLPDSIATAAPGLRSLLDEAEKVWRTRVDRPGWRSFEDAFPTFYQFTNRPR